MLRLVRSALRTADRLVQLPSSPARLKQPWNALVHNLKGGGAASAGNASSYPLSSAYNIPRHAHHSPPLRTTLSFPTRVALGRSPISTAPFLPRTPMLPPSITQVGLGTARNFSSTRHVFQNLIENVPVSARALSEADWDLRSAKGGRRRLQIRKRKAGESAKMADKSKPIREAMSTVEYDDYDASHYFAAPAEEVQGKTAYLTIPLHPVSERSPLPRASFDDVDSSTILPVNEILSIHDNYALHAIRVSSLFTRLDCADVWSRGVECECYGGPGSTAPAALRIVFRGWTKDMVLNVIGEAGRGWCELTEEGLTRTPDPVLALPRSNAAEEMAFVIPSLDFSSGFLSQALPALTVPPSPSSTPFSDWTPTRPSSPSFSSFSDETFSSMGLHHEDDLCSHEGCVEETSGTSLGFSVDFLSRHPAGLPISSFTS